MKRGAGDEYRAGVSCANRGVHDSLGHLLWIETQALRNQRSTVMSGEIVTQERKGTCLDFVQIFASSRVSQHDLAALPI